MRVNGGVTPGSPGLALVLVNLTESLMETSEAAMRYDPDNFMLPRETAKMCHNGAQVT